MPSDLQITNIKDQANANSAITIASDGQITVNQNNPTITLGSNASINTQDYIVYKLPSIQTLSHATYTLLNFTTEVHDPNNPKWFDNSTMKFQPGKAGKYLFNLCVTSYANDGTGHNELTRVLIKKNNNSANADGLVASVVTDLRNNPGYNLGQTCSGIVDLNGSSDYIVPFIYFVDYQGDDTGKVDHEPTLLSIHRIGS